MNHPLATSITHLRPCAPATFPHVDDIHQVAGPLAAILFALAALVWIASVRLHHNGRFGWALTVEVVAALVAVVGVVGLVAWPMSHTC